MLKPILISNGTNYVALCTASEYHESLCPIHYEDIIFLCSLNENTIITITCFDGVNVFNNVVEEQFKLGMDIQLTQDTERYSINEQFSIVSYTRLDEVDFNIDIHGYREFHPYIEEFDDYTIFHMDEYLESIDNENLFRLFLNINIPGVVLNRNRIVYDALNTYFNEKDMENFEYELGVGMYVVEFKTYYMNPQRQIIDGLLKDVEEFNDISKHQIYLAVNNHDNPILRNIGEIQVSLSFEPEYFKKQLFHIVRRLRQITEHDITLHIIA